MSAVSEFRDALANQAGPTLLSLANSRPSLNIGDLKSLVAEYPVLGELTLSELVSGVEGKTRGRKPGKKMEAKVGKVVKAVGRRSKAWNVRTGEGRAALDTAVLAALSELGGKDVAAGPLRDNLGATAHQLRTSLNRHIEGGIVTFTGKARGTRYSMV